MVTIGVDTHKRNHTAVAVEGTGHAVAADRQRDLRGASRVPRLGGPLRSAMGHRGLPTLLPTRHGRPAPRRETVVPVPPKLMAGARSLREPGKSDPSTPPRWPGHASANRNCPWHDWTARSASCACWSIGARTWSPSARAMPAACAPICTSSSPAGIRKPAVLTGGVVVAAIEARLEGHLGVLADIARAGWPTSVASTAPSCSSSARSVRASRPRPPRSSRCLAAVP